MANSRKPGKAKTTARARKAAEAKASNTGFAAGPVTLAEARALARAKQPKLAKRALSRTATPAPSPAAVGAERKEFEKERRKELAHRVRDYKAAMTIMKKRGARPPQMAKAKSGAPAAKAIVDPRRRGQTHHPVAREARSQAH